MLYICEYSLHDSFTVLFYNHLVIGLSTQHKYLQDYASKLQLNIQYETEIVDVSKHVDGGRNFHLTDQHNNVHQCRVVIVRYWAFVCE